MRFAKRYDFLAVLTAILLLLILSSTIVNAQSSSPNYKVEESYFGIGGQTDSSSPNYRARQSVGALGVGSAASNNYDAVIGFNTPSEPFLEVYVTGAQVDLGIIDDNVASYGSAQAGDCNCSFSVRSYLSSDYYVLSSSNPPANQSGHILQNKSTQGSMSTLVSEEEFGINLVANSNPAMGANPVNQPDDSFADGEAAPGYEIADQFKYVSGDVVVKSPKVNGNPGIGKTDYTITYAAKIKSITPSGDYKMKHDIIVVASY